MEKTIIIFTTNYFFISNGELLVCFSENCPDIDINPEDFVRECNLRKSSDTNNLDDIPNIVKFGQYVSDSQFNVKGKMRYSKAFEEFERWKQDSSSYIDIHKRYSFN